MARQPPFCLIEVKSNQAFETRIGLVDSYGLICKESPEDAHFDIKERKTKPFFPWTKSKFTASTRRGIHISDKDKHAAKNNSY